jgi:hypothetical protein
MQPRKIGIVLCLRVIGLMVVGANVMGWRELTPLYMGKN